MTRLAAALGIAALLAALTTLATWVLAIGSPVPSTLDVTQADVTRAGSPENLSAAGTSTASGAIALGLACVLGVVALWSVSPSYRPGRAGYTTILVSASGIAAVLWLIVDAASRTESFGSSVDVQTDTITLTVWPWATLGCFALTCVLGVLLVPRRAKDD